MQKAITAFIVSAVGLGVAFGFFDEGVGQQITIAATALANVAGVYLIENK